MSFVRLAFVGVRAATTRVAVSRATATVVKSGQEHWLAPERGEFWWPPLLEESLHTRRLLSVFDDALDTADHDLADELYAELLDVARQPSLTLPAEPDSDGNAGWVDLRALALGDIASWAFDTPADRTVQDLAVLEKRHGSHHSHLTAAELLVYLHVVARGAPSAHSASVNRAQAFTKRRVRGAANGAERARRAPQSDRGTSVSASQTTVPAQSAYSVA